MINRRKFVTLNGIGLGALAIANKPLWLFDNAVYESRRPALADRKFTSIAVEATITRVKAAIKDPQLAWLFENCYPNTLDTTVNYTEINGKPDTFVITGDINAMWLRDSCAQVWPYLPLIRQDEPLRKLILGVINRQAGCIITDPYANAFNYGPTGSEFDTDSTDMKPELHERKWEVDSLCYPVRLAYHYWKTCGDTGFFDTRWQQAAATILKTFKEQQRKQNPGPYHFMRKTEIASDTAPGRGYGNPVNPVGLICSVFRPSDDATVFPFLVPSNYFAVATLHQLAEIFITIGHNKTFAAECTALANEVNTALTKHAIVEHPACGQVLAYEIDGFGGRLLMDDANVPSLLSLPYLGAIKATDPLYQNTRRMVLSEANPYYFKGTAAEGTGGPHIGSNYIWPMGIIVRAITSTNPIEISKCLHWLKTTHAGTGFMHESFNKDNPADYTRKWFAWANTLFGELMISLSKAYPQLLSATNV